MYTDIFIDFDDTLYDTYGNACLSLAELFDHFHLSNHFDTLEDFTTPYWSTNIDLWTRYSRGEITRDYLILERFRRPLSLGRNLNPTPEYCLQVSDVFLSLCSEKPGTVSGAHKLMQYLKSKGYRLHMASNGFHEVQFKKLRASNMYDYFDTIILSDEAGATKPSPQFFRFAMERATTTPDRSIMIGDNVNTDIAGAHAFAIDQIWFNPYRQEQPAAFTPTHTVATLQDIMNIL